MNKKLKLLAASAALAFASFTAQAAPVVVDVSGAQSINLQGEAGNVVWLIDIGANAVLTSLEWNVALTAFDPSVLAELQVSFGSSSGLDALTFAPGSADYVSGDGSYAGSVDLTGFGITAGADGLLRLEFSEDYKDFAPDVTEGLWVSGALTFGVAAAAVPEPGGVALTLLGLGLLGAARRQRRS
jgi:hypothetical protein